MTEGGQFTNAFVEYLSGNKGPEGQCAEYGISAEGDESSGVIKLTLVFKAGVRYCCAEWGCHLGVFRPGGWDDLRRILRASGFTVAAEIELRLKVVVEDGAFFFVARKANPSRREYEHTVRESEVKEPRASERPPNYSGVWTQHDPDGKITSESDYLDGRLHGRMTEYKGNGLKHRESHYLDGMRHGTATQWNSQGEVIDVSEWDHGTGTYRIFYSSGQLCSEHQQRFGKAHGITRYWNGKGELICTEQYEDGQLIRQEGKPRWTHLCAFQAAPAAIVTSDETATGL